MDTNIKINIERSFLIIKTTTDYIEPQKMAKNIARTLKLEYEPKTDCWPDKQYGFDCEWECGCGDTHNGYLPRGRVEGNRVSIEHSNAYDEFADGYYMVIISSGNAKDMKVKLKRVTEHYQDAYVKVAKVYVGCMH